MQDAMDTLLGRGIKIKAGGAEFELRPPVIGKDQAWREELAGLAGEILGGFSSAGEIKTVLAADDGGLGMVARLLHLAIMRGPERMRAITVAYAAGSIPPEAAERMTAAEAIAGMRGVLKLESDFFSECWGLWKDVSSLMPGTNGSAAKP